MALHSASPALALQKASPARPARPVPGQTTPAFSQRPIPSGEESAEVHFSEGSSQSCEEAPGLDPPRVAELLRLPRRSEASAGSKIPPTSEAAVV